MSAARSSFAEQGFSKTTMRSIAAKAKVDPALVHYFFQNKEQLFAAAIDLPVPVIGLSALLALEGAIGERLARFFLDEVFGTRAQVIAAILRTALSEPDTVPALRARIETNVVAVLSLHLSGPDARVRAELLGAQMIGLFIMRHVIHLEPVASTPTQALAALLGKPLDALLGRSPR